MVNAFWNSLYVEKMGKAYTMKVICITVDCPIKKECLRFTAKASERQQFAEFKYGKRKGCQNFVVRGKDENSF